MSNLSLLPHPSSPLIFFYLADTLSRKKSRNHRCWMHSRTIKCKQAAYTPILIKSGKDRRTRDPAPHVERGRKHYKCMASHMGTLERAITSMNLGPISSFDPFWMHAHVKFISPAPSPPFGPSLKEPRIHEKQEAVYIQCSPLKSNLKIHEKHLN